MFLIPVGLLRIVIFSNFDLFAATCIILQHIHPNLQIICLFPKMYSKCIISSILKRYLYIPIIIYRK